MALVLALGGSGSLEVLHILRKAVQRGSLVLLERDCVLVLALLRVEALSLRVLHLRELDGFFVLTILGRELVKVHL